MAEKTPSILSDAINAVASLARKPLEDSRVIITRELYNRHYYLRNNIPTPIEYPETDKPEVKRVNSLEALVAMIQCEGLRLAFPGGIDMDGAACTRLFVQVRDEKTVICRTASNNPRYESFLLYKAEADVTSNFRPGYKYGHEEAMILLRSQFQPTEDRDYLLNTLASVTSNATVKSEDNGLSQSVTVNKGICNVQMAPVKSIVRLAPYRTFYEVEQPVSEFLVRLSVGDDGAISIALHEADGGMWRMDARHVVRNALEEMLEADLGDNVVVTA